MSLAMLAALAALGERRSKAGEAVVRMTSSDVCMRDGGGADVSSASCSDEVEEAYLSPR